MSETAVPRRGLGGMKDAVLGPRGLAVPTTGPEWARSGREQPNVVADVAADVDAVACTGACSCDDGPARTAASCNRCCGVRRLAPCLGFGNGSHGRSLTYVLQSPAAAQSV